MGVFFPQFEWQVLKCFVEHVQLKNRGLKSQDDVRATCVNIFFGSVCISDTVE